MSAKPRTELALGTVQFGLPYGVAGATAPVSEGEIRAILESAWRWGVRTLDTAPVYGSIEERLARLAGDLPFRVVSKIAPLPLEKGMDACVAAAIAAFERSLGRLGPRLRALLFHRAEDLQSSMGEALWNALSPRCEEHGIALGVSAYDAATVAALKARFPLALAQIPGNAFDQGPAAAEATAGTPTHLRSVFLQGLLLMPPELAARRVPAAAQALKSWHDWCRKHDLDALRAALGIVKSWDGIEGCVIGVDGLAQMEQVAHAWSAAEPIEAGELACDDVAVIDPRRWPQQESS